MRGKRYTGSHYDPCVYYNKLPGGEYIYLLLYADDILIASNSRSIIDKLKKGLVLQIRDEGNGLSKEAARHED